MRRYDFNIAHEANITIYLRAIISFNNLNHVALRRNPKINFFMVAFMVAMVTTQDAQPHLGLLLYEDYGP